MVPGNGLMSKEYFLNLICSCSRKKELIAFPPKLFSCWSLHPLSQRAQASHRILIPGAFLCILSLRLTHLTFLFNPSTAALAHTPSPSMPGLLQ